MYDAGPLRMAFDADNPADPITQSELLKREMRGIDFMPIDDSIGEGPHAAARRVSLHARGGEVAVDGFHRPDKPEHRAHRAAAIDHPNGLAANLE